MVSILMPLTTWNYPFCNCRAHKHLSFSFWQCFSNFLKYYYGCRNVGCAIWCFSFHKTCIKFDRWWWKNQFQLLFWSIQCFYFFNFYLLQRWSFNLWSWSPVLICIYSCSFQVGSCECTILFCSHVVERNCSKSQLVNCSWYCPGKLTFIFMHVDEAILNTPSNM